MFRELIRQDKTGYKLIGTHNTFRNVTQSDIYEIVRLVL